MNIPHPFEAYQGPMQTRMGQAFPGERAVFRGRDLHSEILKNHSNNAPTTDWFELFMYALSGRQFSPSQLRILNFCWVNTNYADVRLWNNRIAALAASSRSTSSLGLAASCSAIEAELYGLKAVQMSADFLQRTQNAIEQGIPLPTIIEVEIKRNKYLKGFGRPIANNLKDERIAPLLKLMAEEKILPGPYLELVNKIEQCLPDLLRANYAAYIAAVPLDFGLSMREIIIYLQPFLLVGSIPGVIEAYERPEGATFPLKCEQIICTKPSSKKWDVQE